MADHPTTALKADFEQQSWMITIELQRKLHGIQCTENRNICTHFDNIQTMQEELASQSRDKSQ